MMEIPDLDEEELNEDTYSTIVQIAQAPRTVGTLQPNWKDMQSHGSLPVRE